MRHHSIIALTDIFSLFIFNVIAIKEESEGKETRITSINPEPYQPQPRGRFLVTCECPLGGASGRRSWPRVQRSLAGQQRCYLLHQLSRRHSALKLPPRRFQATRVSRLSRTVKVVLFSNGKTTRCSEAYRGLQQPIANLRTSQRSPRTNENPSHFSSVSVK